MKIISDQTLLGLVEQVAETLSERNLKLVTAESCTGGWLAKCCTDLTGCSNWFERGFITYSNQAKQDDLGVMKDTIKDFGAVSEYVAEEMALGALQYSNADTSVAITGIAGPSGGSETKPVGTVWIAWASKNHSVYGVMFQFKGDRDAIRRQAVKEALSGIIKNARD